MQSLIQNKYSVYKMNSVEFKNKCVNTIKRQ